MTDPNHMMFIVAAYGVAAFVIMAMITSVIADHRTLKRALVRINKRGGDSNSRR